MFTQRVVSLVLVVTLLTIALVLVPSQPAPAAASEDPGVIAYVDRSTYDIHVISPDGTNDRVLWTAPQPLSEWPVFDLAWRPDGSELAFSSQHEEACSWYQSDVYAIRYDSTGYRRITNAPACAELTNLPKGSVTVNVSYWTSDLVQLYVAGAPGPQTVLTDGTITIEDVADFGPGIAQPAVGIWGLYRIMASPPLADVQPGESVPGGNLIISPYSGIGGFGAGKISWKADGSTLAYGMRTSSSISQIPAVPPYGSIGDELPVVEYANPGLVAWGTTPATKDQYLYYSEMSVWKENVEGIYLNTADDASGGTQLVIIPDFDGQYIHDIEWLPDGSGFLFSNFYVDFEYFSDIFEYNFATQGITKLTPSLLDESGYGGARGLSISPDGQQIVFERAIYPFDTPSSLWIMNRDGSGMHKLADDAGSPAWGQTSSSPPAPFPAPTITSLNPSGAILGGSAFSLTVNGTNFVSGSIVRWNGSDRATTYINNTQLTASIPASDLATAGSASVTVFNPAPGGGTSNSMTFPINDPTMPSHRLYIPLVKR